MYTFGNLRYTAKHIVIMTVNYLQLYPPEDRTPDSVLFHLLRLEFVPPSAR